MTGYGRAKKTLSNRDITVEVRSVNNRYLDCTVKLPRAYIFAEDAIKGRVQKAVSRGKVDVFVTIDSTGADEEVVVVNEGLARSYLEALRKLYEIDGGNYLQKQSYAADLARIPDVLTVTKAEEDLESVGADICEVLDEALASYNQMRATEGKKLAEDIGGNAHRQGRGALARNGTRVPRKADRAHAGGPAEHDDRRVSHPDRGRHLRRQGRRG